MEQLVSLVLEAGAEKAVVIPVSQVVLSDTFFDICKSNACGNFGRCWMCPPDIGDIHELMAELKTFRQGLLYQSIGTIEDSFDIEGMQDAAVRHAHLSQRVEAALAPVVGRHLHLSCGGCRLCETCAKRTGEPCRMPDKALPPMEGYGIDVYQTCKDTHLKYINGQNTVTFFGIVMFDGEEKA